MQSYDITIGADVRAYAALTLVAKDREEAIAKALERLERDAHNPHGFGFTIYEGGVQGEVSIKAVPDDADEDDEVHDEWQDVPTWSGSPRFEPLLDLVRQLARMDPPDERDEIAEVDGEIEAFSRMIRKAKEVVAGIPTAPVEPSVTGVERAMFDLLCENFGAWDGEEDSVKEEHADLIEKTETLIDANRARFYPATDTAPTAMEDLIEHEATLRATDQMKAALQDCVGALSSCTDLIEQMRGMFDDEDGTIQDALDAAEEAGAKARAVLT